MIDIVIPTYNRLEFLQRCIKSVHYNTKVPYNLYIVDDCSDDGTQEWLASINHPNLREVILNKERRGLTFGFDILWDVIKGMDWFYNKKSEYLCLLQDDTEVMEEGWLEKLIKTYQRESSHYRIGFFSGHDALEHPTIIDMQDFKLKVAMRATNIIAPWSFWESIGKVPRLQPNGSSRGFPSPGAEGQRGRGSNFDVYLTGFQSKGQMVDLGRTTEKSSGYIGVVCLVIPGLVKHTALNKENSTWNNKNVEQGT